MKTQVAIVGGGPAGAASALFLIRQGIKPVIIEADQFPRFHIGESMTGESAQVVRRLGLEKKMLTQNFPEKHGVRVYGATGVNTWFVPVAGRNEKWEMFENFTWQITRARFDKMFLDEAVSQGATLIPGRAIRPLIADDGTVSGVVVRTKDGLEMEIESEMLLDCSGQSTFLASAGVTGPKYMGNYDKQIAIFSQLTGALRESDGTRESNPNNTLIFYQGKFHWSWFIPLSKEVMSIGVVVPAEYFQSKKMSPRDFLISELPKINPEIARRLPEGVKLVEDVHVIPNYSFQVKNFHGKGYMCIGDSHRFVDPIFSFGLSVALREAEFAAPVIKAYLEGKNRDLANPTADLQLFFEKGIDTFEDMIDLFWEKPYAFSLLVHERYRESMIDIFSGRAYPNERQPSDATMALRKMLRRTRDYSNLDIYSVPIGSRYNPERAPLWEPGSIPNTDLPVQKEEAMLEAAVS